MLKLEEMSSEELRALAVAAEKVAEKRYSEERGDRLRAAIQKAVAGAGIRALDSAAKALGVSDEPAKKPRAKATEKNIYRWNESVGKNCQINPETEQYVEPLVYMRGPKAATPVLG